MASAVGFVVAAAATVTVTARGAAYVVVSVIALVMLVVLAVSVVFVIADTTRLRRHAPEVRGPARAAHRAARHDVLAHPHHHHRHPVAYGVGLAMLAGWVVGGVVLFPRLVDSAAYLAGAGTHATFTPTSYVTQCTPRTHCVTISDGVLKAGGHTSAATWPVQMPIDVPFPVREPVWRWALGSGLTDGDGSAIGAFFVSLLFDGAAVLAVYIAIKIGRAHV